MIREWSIAMISLFLAGIIAIVLCLVIRLYFHMNPFFIHVNYVISLGGIFFGLIVGFVAGIGARVFTGKFPVEFIVICVIFAIFCIVLERLTFVGIVLMLSGYDVSLDLISEVMTQNINNAKLYSGVSGKYFSRIGSIGGYGFIIIDCISAGLFCMVGMIFSMGNR